MNHLAIFDELFRSFDVKSFRRRSEKLNRLEGNESYANYERSTGWCRRQLEKAGLKDVRRYSLQADGKTVGVFNYFLDPPARKDRFEIFPERAVRIDGRHIVSLRMYLSIIKHTRRKILINL